MELTRTDSAKETALVTTYCIRQLGQHTQWKEHMFINKMPQSESKYLKGEMQYKIKSNSLRVASILGNPLHMMFTVRRVSSSFRVEGLELRVPRYKIQTGSLNISVFICPNALLHNFMYFCFTS
jgi:hypothetical protein